MKDYNEDDGRRYKVYLAKLKRRFHIHENLPMTAYKVGITSYADAAARILYRGEDEDHPITEVFDHEQVQISASTKRKYTRGEALRIEDSIMDHIKSQAGDKHFHNWYEPIQISGITEMRKWDYNEWSWIREQLSGKYN